MKCWLPVLAVLSLSGCAHLPHEPVYKPGDNSQSYLHIGPEKPIYSYIFMNGDNCTHKLRLQSHQGLIRIESGRNIAITTEVPPKIMWGFFAPYGTCHITFSFTPKAGVNYGLVVLPGDTSWWAEDGGCRVTLYSGLNTGHIQPVKDMKRRKWRNAWDQKENGFCKPLSKDEQKEDTAD